VTYVCNQCHGTITNFDFPVADYNGDGVIEGVQTEVQTCSTNCPPSCRPRPIRQMANYVARRPGQVQPSTQTNWPAKFLQAAYNWQFVSNDGSLGVHNGPSPSACSRHPSAT
jgi:hypothetical protein